MQAHTTATPDTLVAVMICPWLNQSPDVIAQTHQDYWSSPLTASWPEVVPEGEVWAQGTITFEDGTQASVLVEEALPDALDLVGECPIEFQPSEMHLLEAQRSCWRVSIPAGSKLGKRAARHMIELMTTFTAAGAAAVFMPALMRLHSPGFIRQEGQDPDKPETIAKLCLSAWHEDDWMITRGLTAFGMPELEVPTGQGLNGAYFCLMDVAANMIFQMGAYPPGRQLQIGHHLYDINTGPRGPEDDLAVNGIFGTMTISPA